MQLIPEWMSNIHPLIVHFPIALLLIAVAADLVGLILKRYDWLKPAALWLYVFGAAGTVGAFISGKQAADVVHFPPSSYPVIGAHADLALYTMLFFSIYAIVRLLLFWKQLDKNRTVAVILFVIGGAGLGLIQQTAEHGGELVFRYGVGTVAQQKSVSQGQETPVTKTINIAENGSWNWQAGKEAALTLRQNFKLIQGEWDDITLQNIKGKNGEAALSFQTKENKPLLLSFGPDLENLQISIRVNLTDFNGRFFTVHHISGRDAYDFLAVEDQEARLGRTKNGSIDFFDTGATKNTGWLTLKAVSSSGHYRGYVNDKLIVHGHDSDLQAGPAGFLISGSGSIQISRIEVISLDEAPPMKMDMNEMSHKDSGQETHSH